MTAKIMLTVLFAFFLYGGIIAITEDNSESHSSSNVFVAEDITKTIEYNGELIPMIELPTLVITGTRRGGNTTGN